MRSVITGDCTERANMKYEGDCNDTGIMFAETNYWTVLLFCNCEEKMI